MRQLIKEALDDARMNILANHVKKNYVGKCFKSYTGRHVDKVVDCVVLNYDRTPILGIVVDDKGTCENEPNMKITDLEKMISKTTGVTARRCHKNRLSIYKLLSANRMRLLNKYKGTIFHDRSIGYCQIEDFSIQLFEEGSLTVYYKHVPKTEGVKTYGQVRREIVNDSEWNEEAISFDVC